MKDKMVKIMPYPRKREAKYAADLMLQKGCLVSSRPSLLKKPWPPNFDRLASGRTNLQCPRRHEQPARCHLQMRSCWVYAMVVSHTLQGVVGLVTRPRAQIVLARNRFPLQVAAIGPNHVGKAGGETTQYVQVLVLLCSVPIFRPIAMALGSRTWQIQKGFVGWRLRICRAWVQAN